jgi:hypothetical protein
VNVAIDETICSSFGDFSANGPPRTITIIAPARPASTKPYGERASAAEAGEEKAGARKEAPVTLGGGYGFVVKFRMDSVGPAFDGSHPVRQRGVGSTGAGARRTDADAFVAQR